MGVPVSAAPLVVLALLLCIRQAIARYRYHRKYKFPPQLPGWPIIGKLDLPFPGGMHGVELAKKYGEMYTVHMGGKTMVFLNSARVVTDLLEKRASIYSSRPFRPVGQDVVSGGARMLLMGHTDRWRNQRKIMHSILNGQQAEKNFVPFQETESKQLVWDYLNHPEQFHTANQRFSNSVILSVIFGRRAKLGDEQLTKMLDIVHEVGQVLFKPSLRNLPDMFTWLRHLPRPLQWWLPYGEDLCRRTLSIYREEVDSLNEKIAAGTAYECFASVLLEGTAKKEYILTETEKLMIFSTLLEAGSDTSRTVITQLVAGAAAYPEWAKKAQAMLDEVCGANAERLPSLKDREALPYISAVVKEALRWRPFIQTGVPHMLTQDDSYEGFNFPAGTMFTWNAYALALNEHDYPEAEKFLPERFLNDDLKNPLKGHWSFGTGRRVCVSYNVGVANVWIAAACLLYCFDISEDPANPIDTFNSNWDSVETPPFAVKIKPRSQAHADLIKRMHI